MSPIVYLVQSGKISICSKYRAFLRKKEETLFLVTGQPSAIWSNEYWNEADERAHVLLLDT